MFFGDGAGAFPTSQLINLGRNQVGTDIADFDNNGAPDIAVVSSSNKVDVVLGDGLGGFSVSSFAAGLVRNAIARNAISAADFDRDGNPDIAVTNEASTSISVFFGDGAGGFPVSAAVPTGIGEANTIAAPDVNLDGAPDIVVGAQFSSNLSILLSDGARGFSLSASLPVDAGGGLGTMLSGDFNADGAPDIFAGNFSQAKVFALLADPSANPVFRSPGADFSELIANADGSFTRRLKDGTVFQFNAEGLMTAATDSNGNTTGYDYDPATG